MEDAVYQKSNVAQKDERWRQPWLLMVGHNVAVPVILPELVRYGFQIIINITEKRDRGGKRLKHSCEEYSQNSTRCLSTDLI